MKYQKGFIVPLLLALIALLLIGAGTYVYTQKKWENPPMVGNVALPLETSTTPVANQTTLAQTPKYRTYGETDILASLDTHWQETQALIIPRPTYHNQTLNAKGGWSKPTSVQFIAKDTLLVRFEDDNNPNVVVLRFDGTTFGMLDTFTKQASFTLSDWQALVTKYGDSSYMVSTYTIDLVRNGQIVSFKVLTKVRENVFVRN